MKSPHATMAIHVLSAVCLVVYALATPMMATAQGYEWEWSPRTPQHMPTRYVGLEVSAGYSRQQVDLVYSQVTLPCCAFTSGNGVPLGLMVQAEQWVEPWLALGVGAGLSYQSTSLVTGGDTVPRIGPGDVVSQVITEWQLDASMTYVALAAGGRARLFGTHASVGVQVRGLINVASKSTLIERIVAPDDFVFNQTHGKERTAETTDFAQRSSFYLEPAVSFQYDLPLSRGMVLTPLVQFTMPLMSLSNNGDWRYYGVGFGVRLSRGF